MYNVYHSAYNRIVLYWVALVQDPVFACARRHARARYKLKPGLALGLLTKRLFYGRAIVVCIILIVFLHIFSNLYIYWPKLEIFSINLKNQFLLDSSIWKSSYIPEGYKFLRNLHHLSLCTVVRWRFRKILWPSQNIQTLIDIKYLFQNIKKWPKKYSFNLTLISDPELETKWYQLDNNLRQNSL